MVDAHPVVTDQLPGTSKQPASSEIHFEDLSFTYPGTKEPVLKHVTFHLQEGQRIAIVGPSGAGKSTLVNLLLRFWEYRSGEIRLGGKSLHELDPLRGTGTLRGDLPEHLLFQHLHP